MVDKPLVFHSLESPFGDSIMEHFISDPTCLSYSITALIKFHNPIFFPRFLKAGRLFHVGHFLRKQDPMQKSSLDVELLKVPVK